LRLGKFFLKVETSFIWRIEKTKNEVYPIWGSPKETKNDGLAEWCTNELASPQGKNEVYPVQI